MQPTWRSFRSYCASCEALHCDAMQGIITRRWKCPKCEKLMNSVLLERGPLGNQFSGPVLAGFIAVCPHCRTVLGLLRREAHRDRETHTARMLAGVACTSLSAANAPASAVATGRHRYFSCAISLRTPLPSRAFRSASAFIPPAAGILRARGNRRAVMSRPPNPALHLAFEFDAVDDEDHRRVLKPLLLVGLYRPVPCRNYCVYKPGRTYNQKL